jgi:hypothetical protein
VWNKKLPPPNEYNSTGLESSNSKQFYTMPNAPTGGLKIYKLDATNRNYSKVMPIPLADPGNVIVLTPSQFESSSALCRCTQNTKKNA